MQLADYLHGRKNKINCKLCGRLFKDEKELDMHIKSAHK
jgi:uncharacterized C2H2 Zn-finger protein